MFNPDFQEYSQKYDAATPVRGKLKTLSLAIVDKRVALLVCFWKVNIIDDKKLI